MSTFSVFDITDSELIDNLHTKLWNELVPDNGDAPSVQGEMIRALGRISSEMFRNANNNWIYDKFGVNEDGYSKDLFDFEYYYDNGDTKMLKTDPFRRSNIDNQTPLHLAASNGHSETVRMLLESGADIDEKGIRNQTAFLQALYNEHTDVVNILIESGADIEKKDFAGWSPFHYAVLRGDVVMVKILINRYFSMWKDFLQILQLQFLPLLKKINFIVLLHTKINFWQLIMLKISCYNIN